MQKEHKTYQDSRELCRWRVAVAKADSAFLYFTLEAQEGACFYSTLDEAAEVLHREIEITCTVEFQEQLQAVLDCLQKEFPISVKSFEKIRD